MTPNPTPPEAAQTAEEARKTASAGLLEAVRVFSDRMDAAGSLPESVELWAQLERRFLSALRSAEARGAARERERCARLAETFWDDRYNEGVEYGIGDDCAKSYLCMDTDIAAAIRARETTDTKGKDEG